jgi:AAA15 family ATPase/GTPase
MTKKVTHLASIEYDYLSLDILNRNINFMQPTSIKHFADDNVALEERAKKRRVKMENVKRMLTNADFFANNE